MKSKKMLRTPLGNTDLNGTKIRKIEFNTFGKETVSVFRKILEMQNLKIAKQHLSNF